MKRQRYLLVSVLLMAMLGLHMTIDCMPATAYPLAPNPNSGTITILSGETAENNEDFTNNIDGIIDNSGTIDNNDILRNNGYFANDSGSTIVNDGRIYNSSYFYNLNGGLLNNAGTINNNASLINDILGTITNTGTINNNDEILNNLFASIDNSGMINNNSGATLTNHWTLNNNSDGTIVNEGEIVNNSSFNNYGTYAGSGTFTGDFTNYGTIGPGSSPGIMTINGDLDFWEGMLEIEIGGMDPLAYDQLYVTGNAYLTTGTFNFLQWNNYDIEADIVEGDSYEWEFLHAGAGIFGATEWDTWNLSNFTISMDWLPAGFEYTVFLDDYGTGLWLAVNNSNEPIPEPATMLLLGSGLIGLAGFRRKKKK